jgi:hypothetical protein
LSPLGTVWLNSDVAAGLILSKMFFNTVWQEILIIQCLMLKLSGGFCCFKLGVALVAFTVAVLVE